MEHGWYHRFARLGAVVVAALAVVVGSGASASAGGWAIGSLDAIPEATAGRTADVGFTILQHGVTPVDLTDDVGIEIVRADGNVDFFAAAQDGEVGHYTAAVTFPTSLSDHSWNIRMGWFGSQDLGTLHVTSAAEDAFTSPTIWPTARWVMLALTVVLAVVSFWDLLGRRRHPRAVLS